MRGIYIAPVDCESKLYIGVYKKVKSQIKAFKSLGVTIDYVGMAGDKIDFLGSNIDFSAKHLKQPLLFKKIIDNLDEIYNKYDFAYIRFSFANPYMFALIKRLKEHGIKVFVEIPTYPYTNELDNSIKNIIYKCLDTYLWKRKAKNIYRLVLTNDLRELHGIKAINIFNGIDLEDIVKSTSDKYVDKKVVNLIGVANISKWHGYDRVIKGLAEYYKVNRNIGVHFYIVGEGSEKSNLIRLTEELEMNEYVHILGAKYGDDLEKLYYKMDIGVSSLALFRAGGGHDPIKSKEYLAKGIPVIVGYKDRAFSDDLEFVYRISSDDSPVNINDIVTQYLTGKINSEVIVKYAADNLTWAAQIKKVLETL